MKILNLGKLGLIALVLLSGVSAQKSAQASLFNWGHPGTVKVSGKFVVRVGGVETVELGGYSFMGTVLGQVIIMTRGHSDLDVMVNGRSKGVIHINGRGSTVMNIDERADSIIFRNIGDGRAVVRKILVTNSPCNPSSGFQSPLPCKRNQPCGPYAGGLRELVDLTAQLSEVSTPEEIKNDIVPIRSAAGQALAMVQAHGELSAETRTAIEKVITTLENANPWIENLKQTQATFEYAMEILEIKEDLKNIIR